MDEMTLTLNSPITEEQWDAITDVDFERTDRIRFSTKHGKKVEFVKAPQWIPVNIDTEEFPKDDEDVLVIDEDGNYFVAWRSKGRWWDLNPYGEDIKDVRAWMPLPRYEGGDNS